MVQPGLHFVDQGFGDQAGIKPLGDKPSYHSVVPLIGPSLPRGVGMGIVDLGARLVHTNGQLSELRAIVRGYAFKDLLEGVPIFALERRHRLAYAGCCLALYDPDDGMPAYPLDKREQDPLLGLLEQHEINLPVSEDGTVIDLCRALIDALPKDMFIDTGVSGPGLPAHLLGEVDVPGLEDSGVDIVIQGIGADHLFRKEEFKVPGLTYNGIRREITVLHQHVRMIDESAAGKELGLAPDVRLAVVGDFLGCLGEVSPQGFPCDNLEDAAPMDLPGRGGTVHTQFLGNPGLAVPFIDHEGNEDTVRK